jgi:hypothetical protein
MAATVTRRFEGSFRLRATSGPARAVAAVLVAQALDWHHFWRDGPSWRYAALGLIVLIACHVPSRDRLEPEPARRRLPRPLLFALAVTVLMVGSSYMAGEQLTSVIVLWFPLALAPICLWRSGSASRTDQDERLILRAGALFALSTLASLVVTEDLVVVNLENAFVLMGLLALALARRKALSSVVFVAALVGSFIAYPAATYLLAALGSFAWFAFARPGRLISKFVVIVGACAGIIASSFFFSALSDYFQAVGKKNNTAPRSELLHLGLDRAKDHPWLGNKLSGIVTVEDNLRGQVIAVPVHNDYVALAIAGGIVFLAVVLLYLLYGLRAARRVDLAALETDTPCFLGRYCGVTVTAGLITMLFNPVLENLGSTALIYFLVLLPATYDQLARWERSETRDDLLRVQSV